MIPKDRGKSGVRGYPDADRENRPDTSRTIRDKSLIYKYFTSKSLSPKDLDGRNRQVYDSKRPALKGVGYRDADWDCSGYFFTTPIPNSRNCPSATGVGASIIRSFAAAVLGKGITSRRLSAPARIITMRSRPNAIPPCGGVPYSSASRKKPKRERASSSVMPRARKILLCTSCR